MIWDDQAERAIDRFYELDDVDPRQSAYGIMLAGNVMYRLNIASISRSGKSVFYQCNGQTGCARRDLTGEWQCETEPHWPIRFVSNGQKQDVEPSES
jgi:hypothetical protein